MLLSRINRPRALFLLKNVLKALEFTGLPNVLSILCISEELIPFGLDSKRGNTLLQKKLSFSGVSLMAFLISESSQFISS